MKDEMRKRPPAYINPNEALDLQAENDLRKAIYSFEYKSVSNLQLINGGGAAVLASFITSIQEPSAISIGFFLGAIFAFMIGLYLSLLLTYISPDFLSARYRQDETSTSKENYAKLSKERYWYLLGSTLCFFLGIISAVIGWLIS